MIKIFGNEYYLDIDRLDKYITVPSTGDTEQHVSMVKFEAIKLMIETIMSTEEQIDEAMGLKNANISIPFKIAFNTLKKHKILTHI
jgi:hypothetical protein